MRQLLQLNKISTAVKSVLKDNYVLSETAENPVGIMLRSFAMHEYTHWDERAAMKALSFSTLRALMPMP